MIRKMRQARLPFIAGAAAVGARVAAVLAIIVILGACDKPSAGQPAQSAPPKVTVSRPVRQNVTDYLYLTGNTRAVNSVQLVARVEGYLEEVFFRDGEIVEKGQLLFRIQPEPYEARLRQAEGNLKAQQARLAHAENELSRYSDLYRNKATSQTDVDNWRYQFDSAQAALMTAQAQRDLARLDLAYTAVTAPFTGRIDRRLVDPGNLVGPAAAGNGASPTNSAGPSGAGAGTVLARITQTVPLHVYFNVSETDLSALMGTAGLMEAKSGDGRNPVYIGLAQETGHPRKGAVDFAATSVDADTGTLLMRGVLPNVDGKILPGQFVRVKLPLGEPRSAVLVPKEAVGFDQQGGYVMVVAGQNQVERRTVKVGPPKDTRYVIEKGLAEDDRVIVKGLLRAMPGSPVTPVEATSATSEDAASGDKGPS